MAPMAQRIGYIDCAIHHAVFPVAVLYARPSGAYSSRLYQRLSFSLHNLDIDNCQSSTELISKWRAS